MKYKIYKNYIYKGKRLQVYGNTPREVAECMRRKERKVDKATFAPSKVLFEDFCEMCIDNYKTSGQDHMRAILNARVYPFLSGIPISDIRLQDCQLVLARMNGMSQSYISHVRKALKFIFRYAQIEGLILEDPTEHLSAPKGTKQVRRALTQEERNAVIKVGKTKRQYYVFLLMLLCGCRPGEAAECMGKDITEVNGTPTLHIRGRKTALSDRFVPIPKDLYSLIESTPQNEYLSPTEDGNKQGKDKLRRTWDFFKRKLDIELGAETYRNKVVKSVVAPDLVPYCLRHEYCTDLARKGIDIRLAQRLMGHSNIRMTANIYTNLDTAEIINQTSILAE